MKLLLAEDEQAMSMAVAAVLEFSGYTVDTAADGEEAVQKARQQMYDCMIFDIMMPKLDGIEALGQIREAGITTPVIFLTAKSETSDKISGLDAGADDYLTKPFAMKELLARIRSVTRRTDMPETQTLSLGSLELDLEEQELRCQNAIRLSPKEARLMKFLITHAGQPLLSADLLAQVWKHEPSADQTVVWLYISYLQQKLESINAPWYIEGEEGQSFTLRAKPERDAEYVR